MNQLEFGMSSVENYCNNSAYVLGLEILFLNKLYKLRRGICSKDFERIQQIAAQFHLDSEEHIELNYILFKSQNTRLNSLLHTLKFALQLKNLLVDSKHIFEFNILIFKTNIEAKLIARKIRTYLLQIPADNRIWLFEENNPVLHYSVQISAFGKEIQEPIAINPDHNEQNFLEKCEEDILLDASLTEILNKAIENAYVRTIGIVGKANTGKTAFLCHMCQSDQQRYIYLTAHSRFQDASYPFIMLLYQLRQNFYSSFSEYYHQRLNSLLQQIQLTNMLSYKQIEFDVCELLLRLCEQQQLILACDSLDNWPKESIVLLQTIYRRLIEASKQFKLLCCMIGVYYPLSLDEIIHFSEQRRDPQHDIAMAPSSLSGKTATLALQLIGSLQFSAKEKLLAILPGQRVDMTTYSSFYELIVAGLKSQELAVLSLIQKYPYVLDRNSLAQIFQDTAIYEIVDYMLDYRFLLETEDHFGKHLFCTLNKEMYPLHSIGLEYSGDIQRNIASYFEKQMTYQNSDIYSLYVLSENNISLYELIEYELSRILSYGFIETVRDFIDSRIFNNYQPAIVIWDMIHGRTRSELCQLQSYFDKYSIGKENIRFLLPLSTYYFEIENYERSLKINKESIYLFNNDPRYKVYVNNVFLIQSKIYIAKSMFKEAIEYINIGLESLQNNNRSHLFYQFIYLKLLCLFFAKELHSAVDIIENYDFEEYLNLYGRREEYLTIQLLLMRIYFEIGQYNVARDILSKSIFWAKYYELNNYFDSINCWIARVSFYARDFHQGFEYIENVPESEEKLYFLSEGYYFYDEKEKALRCAMLALKLSLKKATIRKNIGCQEFENLYSLQEGKLLCCNGKKDPLLVCIQGFTAYLHTYYGSAEIAEKILHRIIQRPSSEFNPFQHIFHYFYYMYLKKYPQDDNREDILYLSYAISILQNDSSKILSTKIRYNYIYNNYWNNLLSKEGEQHNLLILGGNRNYGSY